MVHVLVLRYRARLEKGSEHRAFLDRWHEEGTLLLSGALVADDDPGEVIVAVGERAAVEATAAGDPFARAGVGRWEIIDVECERVHPDLEALLGPPPAEELGWDEEAVRDLRRGRTDLARLLEGRPLRPVLQRVGGALLAKVGERPDLEGAARRCVAELRERGWAGDEVLALQLLEALGDEVRPDEEDRRSFGWPLKPLPVDIEDLADALDGDPNQEPGRLDLETGEVWPPGMDTSELDEEEDEEEDEDDLDRYVPISPESGEASRDMHDFAATVTDARVAGRLGRALEGGRGVFRRFRDAIHDAGDSYVTQWSVFSDERSLGRARGWLADEGYVSSGSPGRS